MQHTIRKMLSHCQRGVKRAIGVLTLLFIHVSLFAAIPAAPTVPGGGASGNYVETGNSVFDEVAGKVIIGLYVASILIYCGGLLFMMKEAKEHKKWGNFFKGASIGLGVLVIILILLNQAKTALTG